MKNIKKEIETLKQRRTELFTQEITNSPAYKRMFPRVLSLMNDDEKKLVGCVESFDNLCSVIGISPYEVNDHTGVIARLESILSEMENLIHEIDWTK